MDRIESITDVSHSHSYRGDSGESSAQNNQFRLVWWESVISETMDKGPVFGLGFGYDLAKRFLISYEAPLNAFEFDTRSPHSIWITVLGRMGLLGLICFVVIAFLILREAVRIARSVARGQAQPATLVHWCAALILLGSATFGVVLEGPMGAIPFWTLLGFAVSAPKQDPLSRNEKEMSTEPRIRNRAAAPVSA
jgi:O-antigen ligase